MRQWPAGDTPAACWEEVQLFSAHCHCNPLGVLQRPVSDSNSEILSQLVRAGLGIGIFNSLVFLICF